MAFDCRSTLVASHWRVPDKIVIPIICASTGSNC